MAIVCDLDAEHHAGQALEVAGLLARTMKLPLHLVHAPDAEPALALETARALALRWSERLSGDVHLHVTTGSLAEALVRIADRVDATMMVLTVPEPLTQVWCAQTVDGVMSRSLAPVLLVRETEVFDGWAAAARPLCVVLDADFTVASRRAARWIERLAKLGPCELVAVHRYETLRATLSTQSAHALALVAEETVRASVERELRTSYSQLGGDLQFRTRLVRRHLRSEMQLAECAIEERADLVVVGHDIARRGEGDLTPQLYAVLHATDCSVLAVPSCAEPEVRQRLTQRAR